MSEYLKYIPWESINENSSIASKYSAREFFYDQTLPYILNQYIDEILPVERSIEEKSFSPFNDLYKKNALYGYIDLDGDVIAPIENNSNFSPISQTYVMQNFAAKAFNDMKAYINAQVFKAKCLPSDSVFYNINPTNGYISNDNLYISTYTVIANQFRNFCLDNQQINKKIKNHNDFNRELIIYLKSRISTIPVTKSRMTLFYNFKKFSNGLTVKFGNSDPGNDVRKYIDYYLDKGFRTFIDACTRFGFSIDINNPFIITADLNSTAMKKYMNSYGISDLKDLFSKRYKKVYLEDLQNLKNFFYTCYEIFLIDNEFYTDDLIKYCSKEANNGILIRRQKLNMYSYFKEFPDTYWMKLYIYFKNYELNLGLTQQQFENLYRVSKHMISLGKYKEALKFINARFRETGDIYFFNSLQQQSTVIQEPSTSVGRKLMPELIL